MQNAGTGSREIEHTADWELEVWGPDMVALLVEAAMGMNRLLGIVVAEGSRRNRRIELEAADREALLVDFLAELLYLGEVDGCAFDGFDLAVSGNRLTGTIGGAPIASQTKEIKAVTYHRLRIHETNRGLRTRVVFDV